jgi:uncharacterized SAM-binding protein YcdF (DUF218 family)
MRRHLSGFFKFIGVLTVLGFIAGSAALLLAGHWLQSDDEPRPAEAIVVLGGSYFRPLYAADLYKRGLAPLVYVSNPPAAEDAELLASVGVRIPRQGAIYKRILIDRGVPEEDIRLFGDGVVSTVEEAERLRPFLGDEQAALLLVTSPFHVRRAELIFERTIPDAEIIAVGTPYEDFPEKWWTDQQAALKVVTETSKFLFYFLGGRFRSEQAAE